MNLDIIPYSKAGTMNNTVSILLAIILVCGMLISGCTRSAVSESISTNTSSDLESLLNEHQGRVLILLLGRDGCPGTEKATATLDDYIPVKPENVSVVRLDVPLPDEDLKPTSEWNHQYPRLVDTDRKIADKLDFFYYPTLYIFDGQGKNRYIGSLDIDKLKFMVQEITVK